MSAGGADDAVSSRPRSAKVLSIALPIVVAVAAVFAAFAPPEWDAWRLPAFAAAVSWFAWLLWAWPLIVIGPTTAVVRNSFTTWAIPLGAIESVDGGRRLVLFLRDGRRIWAVAAGGGEVVIEGIRRVDAYTEGGHFIRRADDVSATHGATSDATEWARLLRTRLRGVRADPEARAVRRPNIVVAFVTAAAVVVLATTIVLPV